MDTCYQWFKKWMVSKWHIKAAQTTDTWRELKYLAEAGKKYNYRKAEGTKSNIIQSRVFELSLLNSRVHN